MMSRHVLQYTVAATLVLSIAPALIACGDRTQSGAMPAAIRMAGSLPHHKTFAYRGRQSQSFRVPANVTRITVVAVGAQGGGEPYGGGYGGRVWAILPVTAGQRLAVFVGGAGGHDGREGFNGGGRGGGLYGPGGGGGGASDLRTGEYTLADRILIAGGGGGRGGEALEKNDAAGGKGGGAVGGGGGNGAPGSGSSGAFGGNGGSQVQGGAGGPGGQGTLGDGNPGADGSLGRGGSGGQGCSGSPSCWYGSSGGGGGGGDYGGGGGGAGGGGSSGYYSGAGGGGGSSYVEPTAVAYRGWQGWGKIKTRNGLVVISW